MVHTRTVYSQQTATHWTHSAFAHRRCCNTIDTPTGHLKIMDALARNVKHSHQAVHNTHAVHTEDSGATSVTQITGHTRLPAPPLTRSCSDDGAVMDTHAPDAVAAIQTHTNRTPHSCNAPGGLLATDNEATHWIHGMDTPGDGGLTTGTTLDTHSYGHWRWCNNRHTMDHKQLPDAHRRGGPGSNTQRTRMVPARRTVAWRRSKPALRTPPDCRHHLGSSGLMARPRTWWTLPGDD
jgi:hypothetical protein